MERDKTVHVVGVPLDHGAGRRGVNMGPSAIRLARLHDHLHRLGYRVEDHGDLEIPAPETRSQGEVKLKYLTEVAATCRELAGQVEQVLEAGKGFPLVIGGDHSMAVGTISGIASALRKGPAGNGARLGVLWFDAHGDCNTPETSPTGNIHGMPVACLLGRGPEALTTIGFAGPKLAPARLVQVGLRDLDPQEKVFLRELGVRTFTMEDIDRRGMASVMDEAIRTATSGADFLHVSFDIDALDPAVAPGTGTQKLGGLSYREAHLACEMIAECGRLGSMEMVEVNPILDDRNRTAELAVGLIASALGQRIL